jgi:hypothetical protein
MSKADKEDLALAFIITACVLGLALTFYWSRSV